MIANLMKSDTQFDTQLLKPQKIYARLKTAFKIRKEVVNAKGASPLYLFITGSGIRARVNLELHVEAKNWNDKQERAKPIDRSHQDLNLVLDSIISKISEVKIRYRLQDRPLTPDILKEELEEGNHRVEFVAYMLKRIKMNKSLRPGTARRYTSVANNLENYRPKLLFTDVTEKFLSTYRNFMLSSGNKKTTVNGNIKVIKQHLKRAKKDGIAIQVDLDDIETGSTTGNRISLNPDELRRLFLYYFDKKLDEGRQLALGYFLFSCMTGLRISDLLALKRHDLSFDNFSFKNIKTASDQTISLNKMARKILDFHPELFVKKYTPEALNEYIKRVMKNNKIYKPVSFHVARHTFATTFLRAGGNPVHLQKLMGHKKLETTMIYVHITAEEANEHIHKLDSLFDNFSFNLDLE